MLCAHFCILSPSSNVQALLVTKGRFTTSILFYKLDFNKVRRKEKKIVLLKKIAKIYGKHGPK